MFGSQIQNLGVISRVSTRPKVSYSLEPLSHTLYNTRSYQVLFNTALINSFTRPFDPLLAYQILSSFTRLTEQTKLVIIYYISKNITYRSIKNTLKIQTKRYFTQSPNSIISKQRSFKIEQNLFINNRLSSKLSKRQLRDKQSLKSYYKPPESYLLRYFNLLLSYRLLRALYKRILI